MKDFMHVQFNQFYFQSFPSRFWLLCVTLELRQAGLVWLSWAGQRSGRRACRHVFVAGWGGEQPGAHKLSSTQDAHSLRNGTWLQRQVQYTARTAPAPQSPLATYKQRKEDVT